MSKRKSEIESAKRSSNAFQPRNSQSISPQSLIENEYDYEDQDQIADQEDISFKFSFEKKF